MSAEPQSTPAAMIRIRCPACGATFRGKASLVGKTGPCPQCKRLFTAEVCPDDVVVPTAGPPTVSSQPAPVAAAPAPQEPVQFASQLHQYCFTMPTSGWLKLRREDAAALDADVAVMHADIGCFMVAVEPWPMSFDDLKTTLDQAYQGKVEKYRLVKKSDATVAGQPAVCMEFEGRANQVLTRFSAAIFLKGSKAFHLVAMGDPVLFPRLKKEAAAAISSFSFDPVSVSAAAAAEPATVARLPSRPEAASDGPQQQVPNRTVREKCPPAVLTIGRMRALMAGNSSASVARDIAVHTGDRDNAIRAIEIFARWWLVLFIGQMFLAMPVGRANGFLGLLMFLGAFAWPLIAYEWFPRILREHLRRHLRKETGGLVPDPDVSDEDPLHRLGRKPLGQLQLALNRHWEFHERQARAKGIEFQRVRWCGPLRDVFLPIGVVVLGAWIAWQISKWYR